ncbi:MAG: LLM class flavin-dependent oxidoreductase [Pseudomonadota bacterium]
MSESRQLHLGAFMRPISIHTAAWRYPGGTPDGNFNWPLLKRLTQKLEYGKFDAFFMADHLAVPNMPPDALKRSATVTSFAPMTLLPALAAVTERIGLIATMSTTYNAPYHVARLFASLDHLSGGRAGWNVVTSTNPNEARNFGIQEIEHDLRYRRAREFYEVVTGLWDSWADDAFIRDVDSGVFFDPDKLHVLDFHGEFFEARGPLNVARPVQGWPVIVQAGQSDAGRQLAAETAEMVFSGVSDLSQAQRVYADIKGRAQAAGRNPDHLVIMPGAFVVVGDTAAEARAKKAKLDSLVHPASGIGTLSVQLGFDVSKLDLDGPLPDDLPPTNASHTSRQKLVDMARNDGLTVRQLAQYVGGAFGTLEMIGTPAMIADQMQEWLEARACDGFNVMFPYLPGGLDDFVDQVVPELQRRGLFRRDYEGATLREHMGLPRPHNRFF